MKGKNFYIIIIAFLSLILISLVVFFSIVIWNLSSRENNQLSQPVNEEMEETKSPDQEEILDSEDRENIEVDRIAPVTEKTVKTNKAYPQGNIRYMPYSNGRYGFYLEYPDIFTDKRLPTNGDGITLINEEMDTELIAYGSNNIMDEAAVDLYEEDLYSKSHILYKFQKDNWYVISWEEGEDGFYKKVVVGEGSTNTFIMRYPKRYDDEYSPLVEHVFKTFRTPGINQYH